MAYGMADGLKTNSDPVGEGSTRPTLATYLSGYPLG